MGAPANSVWLPLMLMAIIMAMATLAIAQSNETTSTPRSSTVPSTSVAPDRVVSGDLNKAARVEQMSSVSDSDSSMVNDEEAGVRPNSDADTMTTPKSTDGQYDVIDVMAATGAGALGQPKTGQTTRIYTTGEVNDEFWLKHLGDDFKHAIHLQVGGTNEDYNRIINQTSVDGVHEEVHHEYLPGAERPPELQQQQQQQQAVGSGYGYGQPNSQSHLNLDGERMALKDNYLRQQEHQSFLSQGGYAQHNARQQEQGGYAQHNTRQQVQGGYAQHNTRQQEQQHFLAQEGYAQHNTRYNNNNRHSGMQDSHRHTHTHTHTHTDTHTNTHAYPRGSKSRHSMRNRYQNSIQPGSGPSPSIINSSEDTLHAAQSQATSTSAASPSSSSARRDDFEIPLPFKSAFNDYGSRPTRDLTYLLYKRGL